MDSPNRAYVPQLEELRGFAALLVFAFHAEILSYWAIGRTGWIAAVTPFDALVFEGHTGVALFMVLSGFVLSKGVLGRPLSYARFLTNRVLRIAPLVAVVTVFAIYANKDVSLSQAFASVLLLQNKPSIALNDATGLASASWAVSVEFQFYLIAPFLFAFVARDGILRFLLPSIAFFALLRIVVLLQLRDPEQLWSVPYFSLIGRMNQFLFGIGLGALWPRIERWPTARRRRRGLVLLVAGLAGMLALSFVLNRGGGQYAWAKWRLVHHDVEGLFWAVGIAGYILVDPLRRVSPVQRFVAGVGTVSFSLYLLHGAALNLAWTLLPRLGAPLPQGRAAAFVYGAALILPPTLALSALSYWCVERPFLRLRRRYVGEPGRGQPEPA